MIITHTKHIMHSIVVCLLVKHTIKTVTIVKRDSHYSKAQGQSLLYVVLSRVFLVNIFYALYTRV